MIIMVLQSNIRVTVERSLQRGRDFKPNPSNGQEEKQKEELEVTLNEGRSFNHSTKPERDA